MKKKRLVYLKPCITVVYFTSEDTMMTNSGGITLDENGNPTVEEIEDDDDVVAD